MLCMYTRIPVTARLRYCRCCACIQEIPVTARLLYCRCCACIQESLSRPGYVTVDAVHVYKKSPSRPEPNSSDPHAPKLYTKLKTLSVPVKRLKQTNRNQSVEESRPFREETRETEASSLNSAVTQSEVTVHVLFEGSAALRANM
ncbi:hypothetical protein RRG08_045583 [Elysia crispata]|uniref:Uncharacterized protein n=1 Tax=Elysia crispata TaxID=231223 RepID=A0AAE1ACG1_9GAST|nr:hypothetical protein RRG08_045583 [Elysia crispata]